MRPRIFLATCFGLLLLVTGCKNQDHSGHDMGATLSVSRTGL